MRGDGSIFRQNSSKNFFMRYWHNGKKFVESTCTENEKKARAALKQRLIEIGADRLGIQEFVPPQQKKKTVSELMEGLRLNYETRGKWNPRIKAHVTALKDGLGDFRASTLTDEDVTKYIGGRQSQKKANATINRELQLLRQAFKIFRKLGRGPYFDLLPEDNAREGFFERHEFEALVKAMPEDLRDFCRFGYLTGWRVGEIRSLMWADLNMESRMMRLRHAESKNGEARWIPLEGDLLEIFDRRAEARTFETKTGETVISEYVFHREGGKVGDFEKSWASACEAAKIGKRHFHDFRRTAARNMRRAGVPEEIAMKITGHRTTSMFRRYNITNDDDIRKAVQVTQAFVAALPAEKGNVVSFAKAKAGGGN